MFRKNCKENIKQLRFTGTEAVRSPVQPPQLSHYGFKSSVQLRIAKTVADGVDWNMFPAELAL